MPQETNEIEEIRNFMDRVSRRLEDASRSMTNGMLELPWEESMPVDIIDEDEELRVTIDIPGFEQEDIEVYITDHTLTIEANTETSEDIEEENYIKRERSHRSLKREIMLPDEVDSDSVEANLQNGVLTITTTKSKKKKGKQIKVS